MVRTRSQCKKKPILKFYRTEHDDDATYLVTPNHHCQNPSHAHHISHHRYHGVSSCYRYPVADTVVEESTGDSIVTVISNSPTLRANESSITMTPTPNIVLTNSETVEHDTHIEDTLSQATRSLSINKLINKTDEAIEDPLKLSPSSASLTSSTSTPLPTTAPAIDSISNYNETGTDSIQTKSILFQFRTIANTNKITSWITSWGSFNGGIFSIFFNLFNFFFVFIYNIVLPDILMNTFCFTMLPQPARK